VKVVNGKYIEIFYHNHHHCWAEETQSFSKLLCTPINANDLFLAMQEAGYVIFNLEDVGNGHVWDYSWLKLSPFFFN
jgi:hypothetical protein